MKTETLEEYKSLEEKEEIGLLKSVLLLPLVVVVVVLELLSEYHRHLFTTFTSKEVSAEREKKKFYYFYSKVESLPIFFSREIVTTFFACIKCKLQVAVM